MLRHVNTAAQIIQRSTVLCCFYLYIWEGKSQKSELNWPFPWK